MAKLDRLGWAAGVSGTCHRIRLGLRVSEGAALEEAVARLPPGWTPAARPSVDRLYSVIVGGAGARPGLRRMHVVYADARVVGRSLAWEEAMAALATDARLHVAEHSP